MATIRELFDRFDSHAADYYRRNAAELRHLSSARACVRDAIDVNLPTGDFGPLALQSVRQKMIDRGWCRTYINKQVKRVARIFGWGVSQELVAVNVAQALEYVDSLRSGSCDVPEGKGEVLDVSHDVVDKTLAAMPNQELRDIVLVQLLSAARGGEILAMRPIDLTLRGETADYVPRSHKTDYKGKSRTIVFGPKALEIIKRRIPLNIEDRVFPSYNPDSYREAVKRAAAKAGVGHWHPHQLRHSGCTTVAAKYGIEAASYIAGHGGIDTTKLYAHHGVEKARNVMRDIG